MSVKALTKTLREQEATILALRSEKSVLAAKLAAKRKRKSISQKGTKHGR